MYYRDKSKDDKINGKGKYTWKNAKRYTGKYINYLSYGFGVYTHSNRYLYEGV